MGAAPASVGAVRRARRPGGGQRGRGRRGCHGLGRAAGTHVHQVRHAGVRRRGCARGCTSCGHMGPGRGAVHFVTPRAWAPAELPERTASGAHQAGAVHQLYIWGGLYRTHRTSGLLLLLLLQPPLALALAPQPPPCGLAPGGASGAGTPFGLWTVRRVSSPRQGVERAARREGGREEDHLLYSRVCFGGGAMYDRSGTFRMSLVWRASTIRHRKAASPGTQTHVLNLPPPCRRGGGHKERRDRGVCAHIGAGGGGSCMMQG